MVVFIHVTVLTRLSFVVIGRVQGVGFRWFVVENAERLGVTGWVRNRDDGAVEGEAQGEDLTDFLAALKTGPSLSQVARLETHPLASRAGESGFLIR